MTTFTDTLKYVRLSSRWPEMEDFARQIGLSEGGLRKLESGDRVASVELMETILQVAQPSDDIAKQLRWLRDEAKRATMEWSSPSTLPPSPVDAVKLADRIHTEVLYAIKMAGERVSPSTQNVLKSRITLILKAALER